jgi:hypothetical protein
LTVHGPWVQSPVPKKKFEFFYKDLCSSVQIIECQGWGYSSVVEYLPSIHKILGSVPSMTKKKKPSVVAEICNLRLRRLRQKDLKF